MSLLRRSSKLSINIDSDQLAAVAKQFELHIERMEEVTKALNEACDKAAKKVSASAKELSAAAEKARVAKAGTQGRGKPW